MCEKSNLSNFGCGMVIGVRQAALGFSETAGLLVFSLTTISEKEKCPVSCSSLSETVLLMSKSEEHRLNGAHRKTAT